MYTIVVAERLSRKVDAVLFKVFEKGRDLAGKVVRVEVEQRHEVWGQLRDREEDAHNEYREKVMQSLSDPSQKSFAETDKAYRKLERIRREQDWVQRNVSIVLLDRKRVVLLTKIDEIKPWPNWD